MGTQCEVGSQSLHCGVTATDGKEKVWKPGAPPGKGDGLLKHLSGGPLQVPGEGVPAVLRFLVIVLKELPSVPGIMATFSVRSNIQLQ